MKELRSTIDEGKAMPPQLLRRNGLTAREEGMPESSAHAPVSWDDLALVLSVEQAAKDVRVGNRAIYDMTRISGVPGVQFTSIRGYGTASARGVAQPTSGKRKC